MKNIFKKFMKANKNEKVETVSPATPKVERPVIPAPQAYTSAPVFEWNVIDEDEFKERLAAIFRSISKALSKTFGPYGTQTMIEKSNEMHLTKDGFTVLTNIQLSNKMADNLLGTIRNICYKVVINVGDGTTSSIVAADELYKAICADEKLRQIRPKELLDMFKDLATLICEEIMTESTKITDENRSEAIYKVAKISTNGDEKTALMMKDIYTKVPHPTINYSTGLGFETSYEIIEGFKAKGYIIDQIYATNDKGQCELEDCYVMIFDHKIDKDYHYDKMIDVVRNAIMKDWYSRCQMATARQEPMPEPKKLLIMAPYFDEILLNNIKFRAQESMRQGHPLIEVYAANFTTTNAERNELEDLSALLGCEVIKEDTLERLKKCVQVDFNLEAVGTDEYSRSTEDGTIAEDMWKIASPSADFGNVTDEALYFQEVETKDENGEVKDQFKFILNFYVGKLGHAIIDQKNLMIDKFGNENNYKLDILKRDAIAQLDKLESEAKAKLIFRTDLSDLKQRVSKLNRTLVNISVGGETEIAKKFQLDVIDDTVKACESANKYGYNIGGSIIVPRAIDRLLEEKAADLTADQLDILKTLRKAYANVFRVVLANKYKNESECPESFDEIIEKCIKEGKCYDLVHDVYSDDIINPANTDMEIVKATIEIVSLLVTSNQYITATLDKSAKSRIVF